jgi:hypothetical protein
LPAAEARLLRTQRARTMQRVLLAEKAAAAKAAADAARSRLLARSRAKLVRVNAAAAALKRRAVVEHAAHMRCGQTASRKQRERPLKACAAA